VARVAWSPYGLLSGARRRQRRQNQLRRHGASVHGAQLAAAAVCAIVPRWPRPQTQQRQAVQRALPQFGGHPRTLVQLDHGTAPQNTVAISETFHCIYTSIYEHGAGDAVGVPIL
jgi:hypothetical protein